MTAAPPRPEYPRPQLRRERWTSLNGTWAFAFDAADEGEAGQWWDVDAERLDAGSGPFDRRITVPFAYQAPRSGLGEPSHSDVVWYARALPDPGTDGPEGLLLHFGAVDYRATVWVNGRQVAAHEGGHTPFSADLTGCLRPHSNVVVVRAEDPLDDVEQPRGKQFWGARGENIYYTPTTGIWQPVWLEPLADLRVDALRVTPMVDDAAAVLSVRVGGPLGGAGSLEGASLRIVVRLEGDTLVDDTVAVLGPDVTRRLELRPAPRAAGGAIADEQGLALWSPERPRLHDLHLEVHDRGGRLVDAVDSYFGLRTVEVRDGAVWLNNRPRYQRLVLDQGYFPGGLLTAPDDQSFRRDIELAKALGFDGARKHQKLEDPRWLYWADRLGFLVWAEMPSAYRFTPTACRRLVTEWMAALERDHNHPSIVTWVPFNESWGVPQVSSDPAQAAFVSSLAALTRALDGSRPVVANDGWEQTCTDLLTVHDYGDAEAVRGRYADLSALLGSRPSGRPLYATGHEHRGEPVLLTEFGGIALAGDAETWGYDTVADGDGLAKRYDELLAAVSASPVLAGFCYTQLTDVEQEANGLLTFEREPKADLDVLRRATRQEGGSP